MLTAYASGGEGKNKGPPPPWWGDLTDEQREAIEHKVQEMKEAEGKLEPNHILEILWRKLFHRLGKTLRYR